jgi:cytochrome c556
MLRRSRKMRIGKVHLTIVSLLAGTVFVAVPAASGSQAQAPFSYMYTLMVNVVGPAANSLLERSATETLADEDWRRLKQDVSKLTESTSQVAFGGTSGAEEQRAKSDVWQGWAGKLSEAVSAAERAVDHKDKIALVAASDSLVEVCEGCHMAFPGGVH